MAAYRRVYDSRHLQADYQEPGSAPEPYARSLRLVIEYGLPLPFFTFLLCCRRVSVRLSQAGTVSKLAGRIELVFGIEVSSTYPSYHNL